MEKQTRVQKYKNLRDEMKEEVAINRHIDQNNDEEDDFLSFMPKEEKKVKDDTLIQPLSYETLDEDTDVKHAIHEAKATMGKDQFNTRLDILNKIKKEDVEEEHVDETSKMSLLDKLATMSPEEDVKELERFKEDISVKDFMKSQKQVQPVEEEEEEEESKVVTVLNYVIIALIVIFIILIGFLVKSMFF